ncbi:MAG: Gfo/Idh/MocA family oxidoreductase [Ruminococcaceae bacterium]|nr:Gfo/Idh/MocA family oxidoreductase [Oscillospiraceae bacterium]
MEPLRIALIGLDTSHAIEFPRRMQAPDCQPELRVEGLRATTCLRFLTPFTNKDILDQRQAQLEAWGVKVTASFDEAVADCDAIMIEVNDPALHWTYFEKCAALGKPIFLDKPLADTYANGKRIVELARKLNLPVLSASSLRFADALSEVCTQIPEPDQVSIYGPLGIAAAGEGLVWYGVHCFEMLQRAMGCGALRVDARKDSSGVVTIVEYPDKKRGIVELTVGNYTYGGTLRKKEQVAPYLVDSSKIYTGELRIIGHFFKTGEAPLTLDDTLEVMRLLDAAVVSANSGKPVDLN